MKEILDRFRTEYLAIAARRMESGIAFSIASVDYQTTPTNKSKLICAAAKSHYESVAREVDALVSRLNGELFALKAEGETT